MFTILRLASARAKVAFHGGPRNRLGFAVLERLNAALDFFGPQSVGVCVSLFIKALDQLERNVRASPRGQVQQGLQLGGVCLSSH